MTFKTATWYPIAVVLSAINLVAAGFAIAQAEPLHATVHVVIAGAFGLWARHLLLRPRQLEGNELQGTELQDRLEALELEMSKLRHELGETQERLDFTERLLARDAETRRMGPPR